MAKDRLFSIMGISIMEVGRIINWMEVGISVQHSIVIMENLRMGSFMEMVWLCGKMGKNIKELILMVRNRVLGFISFLMGKFMKVIGKMVSRMEKGL